MRHREACEGRSPQAVTDIDGVRPIDLGTTRTASSFSAWSRSRGPRCRRGQAPRVAKPDLIIARNLEMLALARRAKALFAADTPIVYECLDIHRLLLGATASAGRMRAAERLLGRNIRLLITSSPAFVRELFRAVPADFRAGRAGGEQGPRNAGRPRRKLAAGGAADGGRTPGRSAGSARCAAAIRWSCLPPSRAGWTAASRSCFAAGRPIPSSRTSTAWWRPSRTSISPAPIAIPRTWRRSMARCISSGRSISSRKAEFQMAAAQPAL